MSILWPMNWTITLSVFKHTEEFKMNEGVDGFLSEKVSNLLLT